MIESALFPESFLHYVWRNLHFELKNLATLAGASLHIQHAGILNRDQGPDFHSARLRIGGIAWHGDVEIHVDGQDWYRHGHHKDPIYNRVALHVVWRPGSLPPRRQDGSEIPELSLWGRIPAQVIAQYDSLRLSQAPIPCANQLNRLPPALLQRWLAQCGMEKLLQKSESLLQQAGASPGAWGQLSWQALATAMGGPVNKHAFAELASRVPLSLLRRRPAAAEALLFGGAGLLGDSLPEDDSYAQQLRREWLHLSRLHGISAEPPLLLRYLRMRPPAFPTVRIALLAELIQQWPDPSRLLSPGVWGDFLQNEINLPLYWQKHLRFGEASETRVQRLGRDQKASLMINAILPIAYLYQQAHGRDDAQLCIEAGLAALPAEDNLVTRMFGQLGLTAPSALHSQGMLQLKQQYCDARRCMDCAIGCALLDRPEKWKVEKTELLRPGRQDAAYVEPGVRSNL